MKGFRLAASALLVALVALAGWVAPARADASAPFTQYHVKVKLTPEGEAEVRIDFRMDFSQARGRGPYFVLPTQQEDGANPEEVYVFDYRDIEVSSSSGARTDLSQKWKNGTLGLRIGNKNVFYDTPQSYTLTYKVRGLIVSDHPESGLDEFNWDVIGSGWESSFENIQVEIEGPDDVSQSACFWGRSYQEKCLHSAYGDTANYSLSELSPGTPMQVVAGFPAGTFGGVTQIKEKKTTWESAFSLTPLTGVATGAGIAGAIWALLGINRRHARDDVFLGLTPGLTPGRGDAGTVGKRAGKYPVTVQFQPPANVTPGEIGTLLDTDADDVDISATLVDLAVRGYVTIHTEQEGDHLLELHPGKPDLLPFEARLLNNIFASGTMVRLSELRDESYSHVRGNARRDLYGAVVARGWFKRNPQFAQVPPLIIGALLLAVAVVVAALMAKLGWSLLAIPVALLGIGLIVTSSRFRTRTAKGSAALAQTKGFELYLRTAEANQIKFEEGIDVFSRYLPYAMIFGVADRWTKIFADLGARGIYQANTSWFVGASLHDGFLFSHGISNFGSSFEHSMGEAVSAGVTSSTGGSSSFSGFSGGGGFGGGGGGSW